MASHRAWTLLLLMLLGSVGAFVPANAQTVATGISARTEHTCALTSGGE